MKKVLLVCPYPQGKAPSQRFRFEQYLPYLRENGVLINVSSFWNDKQWPAIYGDVSIGFRVLSTVMAFIKRFFLLFLLPKYDTVFIHREATPIGPPWWEWCAAKVFRKRLIYDFDDAVWLPNSSEANAKLVGKLKNHGKTGKIITWSEVVFAGNTFLAEYGLRFCEDVRVVPTTIDLRKHSREPKSRESRVSGRELAPRKDSMLVAGWTGTHSTLKQLVRLFPLLERVHAQHAFRFLLIADVAPAVMPDFVEFRKWQKETEIEDLLEMDIGIMPLYDTDWERGKCGFKALQYMALEIPAVVSGVGVNTEIVKDGENGFVCEAVNGTDPEDYLKWEKDLLRLLEDQQLNKRLGESGRKRVEEGYSVEAFEGVYLEVIAHADPQPLPYGLASLRKGSPPHLPSEAQHTPPTPKGEGYIRSSNHNYTTEHSESEGKQGSNEKELSDPRFLSPTQDPRPTSTSSVRRMKGSPPHRPSESQALKGSAPHEEGEEPQSGQSDPLEVSGMHYGAKRKIFDNARKLRNQMTDPEKVLWEYLRKKPLGFKFRRQHPIHNYVLDFYCHKRRLSIEIDGGYHFDEEQKVKDIERTEYLKSIGIKEIRFLNDEVMNRIEEVVEKIESMLRIPPAPKGEPTARA